MARFWLVTFGDAQPKHLASEQSAEADRLFQAIEVIENGPEYAVLFCSVDDPVKPSKITCQIGFTNGTQACAIWGDRGFPLVDAVINREGDRIDVSSPCFVRAPAIEYQAQVAEIRGISPEYGACEEHELAPSYEQSLVTPDAVFPATWLIQQRISWKFNRTAAKVAALPLLFVKLLDPRYPELKSFESIRTTRPAGFWFGTIDLPLDLASETARGGSRINLENPLLGASKPALRQRLFGIPDFRFEDVEVLGFRIDLARHGTGDYSAGLVELCNRLNFHLDTSGEQLATSHRAPADFRYRPASHTLMVELLRYGKMKLRQPLPSLRKDDYQSQHELLVRLLVGRVDDDTSQARDAAAFVPIIFVDNPWSKVLGRGVQGFDKRMADFCVFEKGSKTAKALRPDGCLVLGDAPVALGSVEEIRLAKRTGSCDGPWLLKLHCLCDAYDGWDDFQDIDLDLAYGPFPLSPTRWRQSDFVDPEFRRSFARSVVGRTLKGLRSIQVSPVRPILSTEKRDRAKTWITGTFKVDNGAQIARPNGTVRLTFCAPPEGPTSWSKFCSLLGGDDAAEVTISVPPGSWYRMRCSMNLDVDDGL